MKIKDCIENNDSKNYQYPVCVKCGDRLEWNKAHICKSLNKQQIIERFAKVIDRDKYNPFVTSRDYDQYLIKILTLMVNEIEK